MAREEVHIGDDWYLGENDEGGLDLYNVKQDKVIKTINTKETALATLREAGYEKGDFLPLYTFNPSQDLYESFTSTTYSSVKELSRIWLQWDKLFSNKVETQVLGQAKVDPGTDESMSCRILNISDSETIAEITGIASAGCTTMGPVSYTPTTTADIIQIKWEWLTDPGVNSSIIAIPFIAIGVKI